VSDDRTRLVADGYDLIADEYLAWTGRIEGDRKIAYVEQLSGQLPDGARVLELGCGSGEPCTRLLAERFDVIGVDLSAEQIARARSTVPAARFLQADLTTLELEPGSCDAVVAIYVLNHVPRELLSELFDRIARWLVPGRLFLASLGTGDEEAWTGEWLGTPMFFSSWDPSTNRVLLRDAGFELLVDELVTIREPEPDGPAQF
jgi:cyclopropane fatty-acyl-phospholipid synthase-like methyltransferase